jgi:hypothetical protein
MIVMAIIMVAALGLLGIAKELPAAVQRPAEDPNPTAGETNQLPEVVERPGGARNPVVNEMIQVLEAERTKLVELYQRAEAAATAQEALNVQREIEATKRATQAAIFRIQARQARQLGDEEKGSELQLAADRMEGKAPRASFPGSDPSNSRAPQRSR